MLLHDRSSCCGSVEGSKPRMTQIKSADFIRVIRGSIITSLQVMSVVPEQCRFEAELVCNKVTNNGK
jgi:hypothetical protein